MLKLYSTTTDDPPNFVEAAKNELATRKGSSSSNGGGPNVSSNAKKKSSFEGKEYSRLSTSEKEAERIEPETVFSSSAEESDIQEQKPPGLQKSSGLPKPSSFRWDGTKLGDQSKETEPADAVKKTLSDKKDS